MEDYKSILLEKINLLKNIDNPFAKTEVNILLKLLGELNSQR